MRNRLDYRSFEKRKGKPYYGSALRRVIAPPPKPSLVERAATWYENVPARFLWALTGLVVAAVAIGFLIGVGR